MPPPPPEHSFDAFEPPSTRQVEDILHPHRRALAMLMRSDALRRGDVGAALQLVNEVASQVLRVERASVWRFDTDRRALTCWYLFESAPKRHTAGGTLEARQFPRYFAALAEERTIAAVDAFGDPRTREFTESYLAPHGIGAMLDAPIFVRGEMVGVVCHEHVGGARRWHAWEELVAGSIADFVALSLEGAERNVAEKELELYHQKLASLVETRTAELTG